ncbi:hypothetical protein B5S33_g1117 [[Candida] boidinii]|nr:hypothetical protein B5S33_g1117 [[Candida] boidinii]
MLHCNCFLRQIPKLVRLSNRNRNIISIQCGNSSSIKHQQIYINSSRHYASVSDSGLNGNNNNNKDDSNDNNKQDEDHDDITDLDEHLLDVLHSYPKHINPTPYEVLGFKNSSSFKKSELKKRFFNLAKVYHPDSKTFEGVSLVHKSDKNDLKSFFNINDKLKDSDCADGLTLTKDLKDERFKHILAAYSLLKEPSLKNGYDQFGLGWNGSKNVSEFGARSRGGASANSPFNSASPFSSSSGYGYAGTWEDYEAMKKRRGYDAYSGAHGWGNDKSWTVDPNSDLYQEMKANRKTILLTLIAFITVYTTLQVAHVYYYDDYIGGNFSEQSDAFRDAHERSESDLINARNNYGYGDSKEERINRFLWFRRLGEMLRLGDISLMLGYLEKEKFNKMIFSDTEGKSLQKLDRDDILKEEEERKSKIN